MNRKSTSKTKSAGGLTPVTSWLDIPNACLEMEAELEMFGNEIDLLGQQYQELLSVLKIPLERVPLLLEQMANIREIVEKGEHACQTTS